MTDAAGNVLERYTYNAFGTPSFYSAGGTPRPNGSLLGIRHLFQGQLWTQETGLNDHRNRQALPAMGVFLQPDPIGFKGDPTNLYRYCGNNPVNKSDPYGLLDMWSILFNEFGGMATTAAVVVTGTPVETADSAGMGPTGPVSVLDHVGSAPGEGTSRDTGGGGGNSSPTPGSSTTPTPTPTPPIPTRMPKYYEAVDHYKEEGVSNMFAGAGVMFLGAAAMTVPGGQLPGAFVFGSGLATALYGFGEYNNADNNAAADVWGW